MQELLKERTGMRVAEEAVTLLVELLTVSAGKIATEAAQAALEDERNTIMARDIQEAFDAFLRDSGCTCLARPSCTPPSTGSATRASRS